MGKKTKGPDSSRHGKKPMNTAASAKKKKQKQNNKKHSQQQQQQMAVSASDHDGNNPKKLSSSSIQRKNPSGIRNKMKRSEVYGKYLTEKRTLQRQQRLERQKQAEALGDDVAITLKSVPRTLDNTRDVNVTMIQDWNDEELLADEADDEFAPYFYNPMLLSAASASAATTEQPQQLLTSSDNSENNNNDDDDGMKETSLSSNPAAPSITTTTSIPAALLPVVVQQQPRRPKVLITTRPRPSAALFHFIADLQTMIPKLHFYPRQSFSLKQVVEFATHRDFTHLVVLTEKSKTCNGMIISHLLHSSNNNNSSTTAAGPTALFKVSSVVTSSNIPHHGASTFHLPELHVHGFHTRLGNRIGRLLTSLFPVSHAELQGRQLVTFHNQRDYIFVRQHRYIFEPKNNTTATTTTTTTTSVQQPNVESSSSSSTKARLQELGPRFTLKLKWLQHGTFDTQFGEYEWYHKRKEMDVTRRTFHL